MNESSGPISQEKRVAGWIGWLIGPLFLVLAAWFVWGPDLAGVPRHDVAEVTPVQLSIQPLRQIMVDPPTALIGGFEQGCMDCHRFFDSASTSADQRMPAQHTHIILSHGLNNRCLNCHLEENRSKLVLHDGSAIGFNQVALLCAKCHGPTYRDWQKGMHGKTMGAWNPKAPTQHRLGCTHCHDPHSPAFDPMTPLPGPNTLRMGDRKNVDAGHDHEIHNPLRVWSREGGALHPAADRTKESIHE